MADTYKPLEWDLEGQRFYETGVEQVALYVKGAAGYGAGVAWNGITGVTESPSGAESNALYANNHKYLNLKSAEELSGTIEAYTYPDEFAECDGSKSPIKGLKFGQQPRSEFGLVYKTKLGNDVKGSDLGYKLHIIYNCSAAPSEKAFATINNDPEAITFSWEFDTTPMVVGTVKGVEYAPVASIEINSTDFDDTNGTNYLKTLEEMLYGSQTAAPTLLTPAEVYNVLTTGSKDAA